MYIGAFHIINVGRYLPTPIYFPITTYIFVHHFHNILQHKLLFSDENTIFFANGCLANFSKISKDE